MEKSYTDDASREDTIKLTVKSLLEVVQTGAKNIEISVMESYGVISVCCLSFSSPTPLFETSQVGQVADTESVEPRTERD